MKYSNWQSSQSFLEFNNRLSNSKTPSRRVVIKYLGSMMVGYVIGFFDQFQKRPYIVKRTVFFPQGKGVKDYVKDSKINLRAIERLDNHFFLKRYLIRQKTVVKDDSEQYLYSFRSKKLYSAWRERARIACNIDEESLKGSGHKVIWSYWTGKTWRQLV